MKHTSTGVTKFFIAPLFEKPFCMRKTLPYFEDMASNSYDRVKHIVSHN